jgi:hypothetical protein
MTVAPEVVLKPVEGLQLYTVPVLPGADAVSVVLAGAQMLGLAADTDKAGPAVTEMVISDLLVWQTPLEA